MAAENNTTTTLNLLNLEILGSFLGISGLLILILTSYQSKRELLAGNINKHSHTTIDLDFAALIGRLVLVTAGFVAANTSTLRLKELARRTPKNGHFSETLSPNVWITLGAWIAFGGGIFALIGDYQRLQQPRVPVEG